MLIKLKQKLSRSRIFNKLLQRLPRPVLLLNPIKHMMIEPTNLCNLQCLFCTQATSPRPKGMMKPEEFKKILSWLPSSVKEVQLHFAGESLLNKELPTMVADLKEHRIKTIISSNGTMPFGDYEKTIRAGLDILIISFDGATKTSYEAYRRGGRFEVVVENLKKMSALAGRQTRIVIQFIVMRHNEHEIEKMKELSASLGTDELWLKSASLNIGCSEIMEKEIIKNARDFLPQNPKYSRYVLSNGKLINKDKPLSCPWIWRSVVLWNGDVAICCVDLDGQVVVGNVFKEQGFERIWQSDRYQSIRRKILKKELTICQNCSLGDNPVKEIIKFKKR